MNETSFLKIRIYFTAGITIAIWLLLAFNYFNGGVPSHHILANKDLPSISNWWGGIVLPLLTWFLLTRIQKRINQPTIEKQNTSKLLSTTVYRFIAALLFGILLSTFYSLGYTDIPGYMLLSVFMLALFVPVYRGECLLGFVIGMTFTFGAVLPTIIGSILTLLTALLFLVVRPAILYIARKLMKIASPKK